MVKNGGRGAAGRCSRRDRTCRTATVVNYDLPWNPVRVVQRTGRIGRLTTRHETAHLRACYPDKQLDYLLRPVGRLLKRIDTAA